MPHLSPMEWSMMFISSWMMLSTIMTNIFKVKNKQMMINKTYAETNHYWKWFQDKNKL